MTEFVLFILVGAIAVAAAVMMLLSDNAVYSALFLIVTMGCIAFLFLLLNAPFLAMIQITVYAGAIMVLFLFVIMLLGAERTSAMAPRFTWQTPFAVGLGGAFLLIVGLSIISGQINLQSPPSGNAQVRILNAATDASTVDVYANDELIATGIGFGSSSEFVTLAPGDYNIRFEPESGDTIDVAFPFGPGTTQTLVAFGEEADITVHVVPTDLSTPPRDTARVVFFNAYPGEETVSLVDLGPDGVLDADDGDLTDPPNDRVLIESFEPGGVSQAFDIPYGTVSWAFVAPNGTVASRVVSGGAGRTYAVERETSQLIALAGFRSVLDGAVHPRAVVAADDAEPAFGGPQAIGEELFTRYLLPFELVSLLLLAALVGAIVLTHKEGARARDRSAMRRRVSRPLATVIADQVGHDVTTTRPTDAPALPAEGSAPAGD